MRRIALFILTLFATFRRALLAVVVPAKVRHRKKYFSQIDVSRCALY